MLKAQKHVLALAGMVLLLVGAAAGADQTIENHIQQAKASLRRNDFTTAARELRAASDSLGTAAVNADASAKGSLEASGKEMEKLAEDIELGTVADMHRIDDASASAEQALASAKAPNDTPSQQSTSFRTLFRDLGGDFKHLPSRNSLLIVTIGGGLALAVHPADSSFNHRLADDEGIFKAGNVIGNTGTLMGASAAAYLLGRATGHSQVAHIGLDLLRAQIITEAMVESLKYTVRRPRPDGSSGYAFPSGHSAMTFATATVVGRHLGLRWAIPVYGLATYVAMSRLHDNVHSISDVVFGAAVGTIAGRTVTRHGRSNFALTPFFTPGGGKGLALVRAW